MSELAILGSVNLDIVMRVTALPRPGETVSAHSVEQFLGGKGANQTVSAARSGADLTFHACVGEGADGAWLVSELQAHSVPTEHVSIVPGEASGRAYVCVDEAGENHVIVAAGVNARLEIDKPDRGPVRIVLAQLETPIETTRAFFQSHIESGARTVLNAAPAVQAAGEMLFPLVDILVVNESELAYYTGIETLPEDIEEITRLARTLLCRKDQVIVVTCGAAGALAISQTRLDVTPARRTRARDTTGSGDCFCGALCARLAMGDTLADAMRYASIAASLSVERDGAAASMPTREDVQLIMFEMNPEEVSG